MEKREAVVYLYLGVLIIASLLAVYLFNLQLTGFAVFEQNSQAAFDEGVYQNVEYNESAIVLTANQTNGTYTSKVFDANGSVIWNNLSWQGFGDLVFQGRGCSDSACINGSFVNINTDNINISSQYFQYRVIFDTNGTNETFSLESVGLDYSPLVSSPPIVTGVSLSQPSGTKTSGTGIPLNFAITGTNTTCWYNVHNVSDNAIIIGNTTLSGCGNSIFTVSGGGNYVLNIYVNGSSGFASDNSDFSVSVSQLNEEEEETPIEEEPIIESTIPVIPTDVTELSLQGIETSTINPSNSKNLNLIVKNVGTTPISACKLSAGGDFSSWLSIPDSTQNLNAGEEKNFAFSIVVPENTTEGNYVFSLSIQCAEISKDSSFTVDVVKKRVEFNVTNAERTRANRVAVTYSLKELLNEAQTIQLQFFLYDANNQEVANASANQTLSAGESDEFSTNIPVNASLGNLTLSASLNSQDYSVSVKPPISIGGAPTGFFVLGDNLGTTGNVLAIIILIVGVVVVFFFLKRKKISKKPSQQ